MSQSDIYNNIKPTCQKVYDSFNDFIFSNDSRVFNKLMKRTELYLKVTGIVGDILEFGVFKGVSIALWLKLLNLHESQSITKVIGFDYFDSENLINDLDGLNKEMMTSVVTRVDSNDLSLESVQQRLRDFSSERYKLIKGNAVTTASKFKEDNPGLRIKLLYMDLDIGEPTFQILKILWDTVAINGIIVFDEYAYHQWDESVGVDNFLKTITGKYEMYPTGVSSPTMYIKKIAY